jgi:hypothetical protein
MIKWAVFTLPFWLPIKLALSRIQHPIVEVNKNKKSKRGDSNE